MKSLQAKIRSDNKNSNLVGTLILPSLPGKRQTNGIYLFVLTALVAIALCACGCGGSVKKGTEFPVNETFAAALTAKGIPTNIARFFAAAKLDSSCPNETTCVYLQTFPNGATRKITLRVDPNRHYTPTPDEIAKTASGRPPIYAFKYASKVQADGRVQIDMSYFVAKEGLPKGPAEHPRGVALMHLAALRTEEPPGITRVQLGGYGAADGTGIYSQEIGEKGAEVMTAGAIDLYKEIGFKVGPLGSIFALASALSNVTKALDLSKQNDKWLSELDALEQCAAHPTNQVAKSDPNYSKNTVAKVQSARSELQEVNAVRFLNLMTEQGADITPVTAVMSIGLKQGFAWSEETLGHYSEDTIMEEARRAVVKCGDAESLKGNLDWVVECTTGPHHQLLHLVANVSWVWKKNDPVTYFSQGTFTYSSVDTFSGSGGGKGCVREWSATGSHTGHGVLFIMDNPYRYQVQSGGIDVPATITNSCGGGSTKGIQTIAFPLIEGIPGTGGSLEGVRTNPSCNSSAGSSDVVKWAFSVPPAK